MDTASQTTTTVDTASVRPAPVGPPVTTPKAKPARLPFTIYLSVVIYLAAFIASCYELSWARNVLSDTCVRVFYSSSGSGASSYYYRCYAFLIVVWALAIVAAAASLLWLGAIVFLHRSPRRVLQRGAIVTAGVVLAVFWCIIIILGWAKPADRSDRATTTWVDLPSSGSTSRVRQFDIKISGQTRDAPAIGMFPWSIDFLREVNKWNNDYEANRWKEAARAGMAALILINLAL
jgi:hypothetical protein